MNAPLISCRQLSKTFGSIEAVSGICFDLGETEFLSILGPSGCGKSTLLRLVAGLEIPDMGSISLSEQEISGPRKLLPPEKRKIGMIFQDFALFPHMNVASNIAYGVRGLKNDKRQRVTELLELINLPHLAVKMPHHLSGGEQQRVAVARSLAPRPRLILMDEPFSNLDYQLRVQLRQDIRDILRKQGVATILVTHDQSEAITFSERLMLMNSGKLVQIGSPQEIYRYPRTLWAASFIGEANLLTVELRNGLRCTKLGELSLSRNSEEQAATMMIRPEELRLETPQRNLPKGLITAIEFAGPVQNLSLTLDNGQILRASTSPQHIWSKGESVSVVPGNCLCYDKEGLLLEDEVSIKSAPSPKL